MDGCTLAAVEKLRAILLIVCGVSIDEDLLQVCIQTGRRVDLVCCFESGSKAEKKSFVCIAR